LSIGKHHRESPVRSFDHLQRIAAFRDGILVDLGNRDLNFHALILLWDEKTEKKADP
jgi:hypothetical protein